MDFQRSLIETIVLDTFCFLKINNPYKKCSTTVRFRGVKNASGYVSFLKSPSALQFIYKIEKSHLFFILIGLLRTWNVISIKFSIQWNNFLWVCLCRMILKIYKWSSKDPKIDQKLNVLPKSSKINKCWVLWQFHQQIFCFDTKIYCLWTLWLLTRQVTQLVLF